MLHRIRTYHNGEYENYTVKDEFFREEKSRLLDDPGATFLEVDGITIKEPAGEMRVYELSRGRLAAVKREYYTAVHEKDGTAQGDLLNIDDLVTDEEVFNVFSGMVFRPDDFTG